MLSYSLLALVLVIAALVGGSAGLLAARWFVRRNSQASSPAEAAPVDPFVAAEIDQAAARWATANGRPEAAGLMADKLHLLHRLGQRRGRRP